VLRAWGIVGKGGTPPSLPARARCATSGHCGDGIADSVDAARSAAEPVVVEYRILPAVTGVVAAMAPGAPQLYKDVPVNLCCDWAIGDVAATYAALATAHHIAKIDVVNNRLVPNSMESRAALAEFEPATGDYTLYTSTPASPCRAGAERGADPWAGPRLLPVIKSRCRCTANPVRQCRSFRPSLTLVSRGKAMAAGNSIQPRPP
jgi:hypothetical protein